MSKDPIKQDLPILRQDAQRYAKADGNACDPEIADAKPFFDPFEYGLPIVRAIGVGGLGGDVIWRLCVMGLEGAETVAVDTDRQQLERVKADIRIQIGKRLTKDLGTNGRRETGKRAAELARSTLQEALKDTDLAFIIVGLGGGTGIGAGPLIAEVTKEEGALVIAVALLPLNSEKIPRADQSLGIAELQAAADAVILLDTEMLQERIPDAQISEVHSIACQLIATIIQQIVDMLMKPSLINVKITDLKSVINTRQRGIAVLLAGEGEGPTCFEDAVAAAVSHPLCGADYRRAEGAFMIITGGPDLSLRTCEQIAETITEDLDMRVNVVWNARIRKDYADKVRIVAFLAGTGDYEKELLPKLNPGSS